MIYDFIVIGGGSAGLTVAHFMNTAGFKVLLIEKEEKSIGGDCLNYGCVPSKAFIHVSRKFKDAKIAKKFGLSVNGKASLKKVMNYVKSKQEVIRKHENSEYLKGLGIAVELGNVRFVNKNTININGNDHSAKKFVIATGSRPRELNVEGIDKVDFLTNETIFKLDKLPQHLLVVGGGPIGLELGQAFLNLGSKVSVIVKGEQILPKECSDVREVIHEQLVKQGMTFYFNTEIKRFTDKHSVILLQKGKEEKIKFDNLLVAIGRKLNTEGLELEKANIKYDNTRIYCNKHLQTSNHKVFLAGDIAGDKQFSHGAGMQASLVLGNFFKPIFMRKKLNNDHLSWVTFTSPEIATFGLNEEELTKRKIPYDKIIYDFKDDDRAIVNEQTYGKVIMFISKNKIVGGTMVAENAGEIIQELVLANSSGLKINHIFNKVYPYPTASRVNKAALRDLFAQKLTPNVKKLLKFLY
jgi:pyruvate/2-oxoglutarate dehydrogenase complex dihydrolipoamide dehydrogenase (E3) component